MRTARFYAVAVLAALLVPATLAAQTSRESIVETANRFATVRWRAEERHAVHGKDASGVRVDTPDVGFDPAGWRPGEENVGMPYSWGGFTSLEGFEEELRTRRFAGHVPSVGNAAASQETVGVDCSGLVSRCWDLPLKQSTRSLGALCYELDDYGQLLPGDIVNRFDAHVAIFTGWVDDARTEMRVIEAARLRVEESVYPVARLRSQDFRPMRYKLLDERWRSMPPLPEKRGEPGEFVAIDADWQGGDVMSELFRAGAVEPGEWARYAATESRLALRSPTVSWMSVESQPGRLELQRRLDVDDESIATGATFPLDASLAELLATFGSFSNPLRDVEESSRTVEPGIYRFEGSDLAARRVTSVIEAKMLSRSTLYPVRMEIECVISDQIPVLGICEARVVHEVNYGERGGAPLIGRQVHSYRLTAAGRGEK